MLNIKLYLRIIRWIPIFLLLLLLGCFFYFHLHQYFTFDSLKQHQFLLLDWTAQHRLRTLITFILVYIVAVASSFPIAMFLTMLGGFLFGIWVGTLCVLIGATLGSIVIFLAVRTSFGKILAPRLNKFIHKMSAGLRENAFYYLLVLRLLPVFPFWIVNIVPALLNIPLPIFAGATALGIIPATLIYASIGHGLERILNQNQTPDLTVIFSPIFLIPLVCLAFLALLPVYLGYQKSRRKRS